MTDTNSDRVWRVDEWLECAGHPFSRMTLLAEIAAGRIDARTAGVKNVVILTSPREYFERCPRHAGYAHGRAAKARQRKAVTT
jgi:hypothetical protein